MHVSFVTSWLHHPVFPRQAFPVRGERWGVRFSFPSVRGSLGRHSQAMQAFKHSLVYDLHLNLETRKPFGEVFVREKLAQGRYLNILTQFQISLVPVGGRVSWNCGGTLKVTSVMGVDVGLCCWCSLNGLWSGAACTWVYKYRSCWPFFAPSVGLWAVS